MEGKVYETNGIKIRYLDGGTGQPLLFLHGAMLSAGAYLPALKLLSKNFRIIAPDLPGFGHSGVPDKVWTADDYGKFLHQFLEDLNLNDVVVAGHSFGGSLALALAALNKRISKVILLDSTGIATDLPRNTIYRRVFTKTVWQMLTMRRKLLIPIIKGFINHLFIHLIYLPRIIASIDASFIVADHLAGRIKIPIVMVWGRKDELLPLTYAARLMKILNVNELITVEGKHDWPLERPEKLVEIIIVA